MRSFSQPDQPLLCAGCYQSAILVINAASAEPASGTCPRAIHVVEKPIVNANIAVKPNGMVKAGDLQARIWMLYSVRHQCSGKEIEVRTVGEQAAM